MNIEILFLVFFISIISLSIWAYWCLLQITLAAWGSKKTNKKWTNILHRYSKSTVRKIKWFGLSLFSIVGIYILSSVTLLIVQAM